MSANNTKFSKKGDFEDFEVNFLMPVIGENEKGIEKINIPAKSSGSFSFAKFKEQINKGAIMEIKLEDSKTKERLASDKEDR